MSFALILNKKAVAFRCWKQSKKEVQYILYNDKETIMELSEQDGYTYHDHDLNARCISIYRDKQKWKDMFDMGKYYVEPKDLSTFL